MRGDDAADHDRARCAAVVDPVDPQADVPVVDQHLVARTEDRAEHRRADRDVVSGRELLAGNHDGVAGGERDVGGQIGDAQLRPLEIGDQRDRAPGRRLGCPHDLRRARVVLVRAVRKVQSRTVHPGLDQRRDDGGVGRGRTDRRDDLRPPDVTRHRVQGRRPPAQDAARGNASQPG